MRYYYRICEYIGDYELDNQKYWYEVFTNLTKAIAAAKEVLTDTLDNRLKEIRHKKRYYIIITYCNMNGDSLDGMYDENDDVRFILSATNPFEENYIRDVDCRINVLPHVFDSKINKSAMDKFLKEVYKT